jgi:hypothetical protein
VEQPAVGIWHQAPEGTGESTQAAPRCLCGHAIGDTGARLLPAIRQGRVCYADHSHKVPGTIGSWNVEHSLRKDFPLSGRN